ncbi:MULTISPECIES: hypothetical protein [Cysteiniphilum]|uniref:hypothetical protein n=1 Tax=Cysteiniphilum TaxID=2056696 RepID=UPI00177EED53|nr:MULTISPECIES: hypothetical protein [Cysteiniphilum]
MDLDREPLADIGFSNVTVTTTKTQNTPTNAAKGVTYPFTYTFTNTYIIACLRPQLINQAT